MTFNVSRIAFLASRFTHHLWEYIFASRRLTLRLFVVLIFLWAVESPPQPIVSVPPRQEVHTAHPIVGVHTRLTDEVEPWKVRKTLEMVREMGSPWIVEFFPWVYSEPNKGEFQWGHADMIVEHARAQGLTVIARIGLVPDWARPNLPGQETTFNYIDESGYNDMGDFVYEFVRHFKGRVHAIILWNEPNLTFEWGFRPVDPAGYAALLRAVTPRAKQADPSMIVLGGALAPTLDPTRLVFLDESGVRTDLVRRYGRGRRGMRVHDATPDGRWHTTTFLAGLRVDGIIAPHGVRRVVRSTAYTCDAPCMFDRKTSQRPSGVKVTLGSRS